MKDIRSFLGLARFYRRFVKGFNQKARPFTNLTKDKIPWKWESAQENEFTSMKQSLVTTLVLHIPDFDEQFIRTIDTNLVAVGGSLE